MINLHQKRTKRFSHSRGFYFRETPLPLSFAKIKTLAKIFEFTVHCWRAVQEKNPKPLL